MMLEVVHNIIFVGTCLCIVSFCVGFRLGCAYQKRRENENITEEKVQAMIDNSIAKAMRDIETVGK